AILSLSVTFHAESSARLEHPRLRSGPELQSLRGQKRARAFGSRPRVLLLHADALRVAHEAGIFWRPAFSRGRSAGPDAGSFTRMGSTDRQSRDALCGHQPNRSGPHSRML